MIKQCVIISLLFSQSLRSFDTLKQLQEFASTMEEFPQPDIENYLNPDYSSFHKAQISGTFRNSLYYLLEKLHLKKKPLWTAYSFHDALVKASETLEKGGKSPIQTMQVKTTDRLYLWGDLMGAFHSLTRDLTYLNKKGVLSDDLILLKDQLFIFNGNVIDQSPYILETLTAVLSLMNKNPGRVFYIAGNHEVNDAWKEYGLKRELSIKSNSVTSQSQVSHFFALLPHALSFKSPDGFVLYISSKTEPDKRASSSPLIKARIQGLDRSISYQITDGLQQLPPDKDAAVWTVFSSPTLTSKKIYQFSSDAFVLITPHKQFSQWTLTLFKKEPKAQDFKKRMVNLLTGQALDESIKLSQPRYDPLVVGCTLDLSKTSAPLGKRLRSGLELRINKENWEGASDQRLFKIIFLDDSYTPRLAQQNILTFIENYKTRTILAPLGTPTTEAFLPAVEEKKIAVIFPYTGAMIFRKPTLTSMVHLRTSYANEAQALVTYAVKTLGAQKFALFYQEDSYGRAPLLAARETLKKFNITQWLETAYVRNNPNIDEPASKILTYNPDVILFFSTHAPSATLIRKLGINKIASTIFMGISFLTDVFRNFLRSKGLELIMARVMPNPNLSDLEIVRNYQEDMARLNPTGELSVDSLEGYINADIFIHVVRSIKGPVNNETIIHHIEQIKNYNYKGLRLNFDPETRELLKDVWIDTGSGPWIVSDTKR